MTYISNFITMRSAVKALNGLEKILIDCLENLTGLEPDQQIKLNHLIQQIKYPPTEALSINNAPYSLDENKSKVVELFESVLNHYPQLIRQENFAVVTAFDNALADFNPQAKVRPKN